MTTGVAAKRLGVTRRSLVRWVHDGWLQPDYVTPGGHYRWDVDRVRREMWERIPKRRDEAERDLK